MSFKFSFNKDKATADVVQGKYVNKSGAYRCKIMAAKIVENEKTPLVNLEMQFMTPTGQTFDKKICMIQNNGEESFRLPMVHALIGLLDEDTFDAGNEEVIVGAKIGVFYKCVCKKGDQKYDTKEIEGFFDLKTNKNFKELTEEKEPKKYGMKVKEYDRLNEIDAEYFLKKKEEEIEKVENTNEESKEDKNIKEMEKKVENNKKEQEDNSDEFPF